MSKRVVFELCAETLNACHAAHEGGAHRIELCSAIDAGGLTPSHALIQAAVRQSQLPVHVLLRPRAGGFVYSDSEFALIEEDLTYARAIGATGFVAGILDGQGRVDAIRMRRLVELAAPLEVTFHRAFDLVHDPERALEEVVDSGCRRLLTSGGATDVEAGATRIRKLVKQSADRIGIAVGGGLRLTNAARIASMTGASDFHASLRTSRSIARAGWEEFGVRTETSVQDVRAMVETLSRA